MVGFKSWTDYTRFLLEYCPCSCLNCKYGTDGDLEKIRFVCMKTLSPVRLDIIRLCVEWENNIGETLSDYSGMEEIRIREDICMELVEMDKIMSFEEIKEYIDNYDA